MTRVVVVGGGIAGLAFAQTLSRSLGVDANVVVVESGTDERGRGRHAFNDPSRTHRDSTVVRTGERGAEWYPRARGVGGGALINGRLALVRRADHWFPMHGDRPWLWNEMEKHLRAIPIVEHNIADFSRWAAVATQAATEVGWRVVPTQLLESDVRGGFEIRTDFHAASLVEEDGCIRGVLSTTGAIENADRVVLAAGALASPGLIGARALSTTVRHHGLKDHPAVCFEWQGSEERHHGVGIVLEQDDIQIVTVHEGNRIVMVGAALRVDSTGFMEWRSGKLVFDFQMLQDQRDVDRLDRCMNEMIRLVKSTIPFAGRAVRCGTERTSLDELELMSMNERVRWLRRNTSGNWHAACSMPMGDSGVVDHDGRVVGYENLWCCDASVLTDLPQSPTQLPVMIAASEIARRFAATTS